MNNNSYYPKKRYFKPISDEKPITGIEVNLKANDSIDKLIKRFKKKVTKSGILKQVVKKMYFEKPSIVKRKEKIINTIRCRKKEEEVFNDLKLVEQFDKKIPQNRKFEKIRIIKKDHLYFDDQQDEKEETSYQSENYKEKFNSIRKDK